MAWAGINSWGIGTFANPISRWFNFSSTPWVQTDSNQPPPNSLATGSDLNRTAQGPWPVLVDSAFANFKEPGSWTPNSFIVAKTVNLPANYGGMTSRSNFGFRSWFFPPKGNSNYPSVGMLPGPIPFPHRPMWNNAPPTIYRQRVSNANSAQNVVQYNPVKYSTVGNNYNGTASISPSGTYQGQVLL